jgi:uncharacterized protein (DUF305 family)
VPAPGAAPGPEPSHAELEALYRARVDSARLRYTDADVRFVTDMIVHHGQALEMARLAPTHGAGPAVRTLAARIVNAQRDEIDIMRQWLRDRGQADPGAEHDATDAPAMHGADHPPSMPGMVSPEQMRLLEAARGVEFERLFLTYMIQHHRGAVEMVQALFATEGAAQDEAVFKLASDVHVDQITEIARMQLMLEALPGAQQGGGG